MTNSTKLTDLCIDCGGSGFYARQISNTECEQCQCANCSGLDASIHLEVDVEAMADCIFSKYSDCADIRIAEHLSTNIPKWARLVRK